MAEPVVAIPAYVLGRLALFNVVMAAVVGATWLVTDGTACDLALLGTPVYGAILCGGLWLAARLRR